MKQVFLDNRHTKLQLLRRNPILISLFFHSNSLWKSRDEFVKLLTSASYTFGRNLALEKQDLPHFFHAQSFITQTFTSYITYTIIILQNT